MNNHYQESLKLKIEKNLKELTTTEQYIAKIIYKNPSLLKNKTLDLIARQINVARTTLYRFIKKIGFENVFDLKHWIIEKNLEEVNDEPLISDIQQTLVNFDVKEGKKFAQLFIEANQIFVVGRGLSKAIGLSLVEKLNKLALNARFASRDDYHIHYHPEKPLWIFISITGTSYNEKELRPFHLFDIKKSILFSAIAPPQANIENFTHTFYSKTKRDFVDTDLFLPLDLEVLCLVVINRLIKAISPFLAKKY